MSILMHETLIVNSPPTPAQLRRMGWNAYGRGESLDTLTTDAERRGWMSANKAHAETLTDGYAESMVW